MCSTEIVGSRMRSEEQRRGFRFHSRVQFNYALAGVSAAEILQQLHESKQFIPTRIRDRAILQIARLPKDEVITTPRQLAGLGSRA